MQPEEVPAELVRIATENLEACDARGILANAIPEIEKHVREQVASEARAFADQFGAARSEAMQAEAATLRWFADKATGGKA